MRHNGQEPMLVKIHGNGFHRVGKTIYLPRLSEGAESDVGDNRELDAAASGKRLRAIGTETSNRQFAPYLEELLKSL